MNAVKSKIDAAIGRRSEILSEKETDGVRLFHAIADGIDGLVIEKFGPALIVQVHEGRAELAGDALRPVIADLMKEVGATAAYRKHFVRDRARATSEEDEEHRRAQPWIGEPAPEEIVIFEYGRRYIIRPYDGFSVGLFLEHREDREGIAKLAKGRRVLNLFAYTCGFSVAAAGGGAASVASVDSSAKYLEWGKKNLALNGIDLGAHTFFRSDVLEFYKRATRQKRRFDLIIVDPPTFSRNRRPARVFVLEQQIEPLMAGATALLEPGGILFFATNDRGLSLSRIERHLANASGGRRFRIVERPNLPLDFAGDPDYSKSLIAEFA